MILLSPGEGQSVQGFLQLLLHTCQPALPFLQLSHNHVFSLHDLTLVLARLLLLFHFSVCPVCSPHFGTFQLVLGPTVCSQVLVSR